MNILVIHILEKENSIGTHPLKILSCLRSCKLKVMSIQLIYIQEMVSRLEICIHVMGYSLVI